VTSVTARIYGQNTRETVGRMQEASYDGAATTTTGKTTGTTTWRQKMVKNEGCPCAMNIYHNFFLKTTRL
jgi:hypothetical protein